MIRSYSELIKLSTYEERFEYLKLDGRVGEATFGYDRYLNQTLYRSKEWKDFRRRILIRDGGCDLAAPGYDINSRAIVHHINPITVEDVLNRDPKIFDPDNVVIVTHQTHQAIHYGDASLLPQAPVVRKPNDTCPWKL